MLVDGKHAPRTEELGRGNGKLPDGAAAEDCHRVARLDVREVSTEVPSRENVRNQDCFVITDRVRKAHKIDVGERHPDLFCLHAVEATCFLRATIKRRTWPIRIGVVALGVETGPAKRAVAAGDGRRDHHAVTDFEVAHPFSDALNHTHPFVAEDGAGLDPSHRAANKVEVRPTNGRRGQPDDGIGVCFNFRLGHVIEADVTECVENDGFHGQDSFAGEAVTMRNVL